MTTLCPEEQRLPYAKYMDLPMDDLPEDVLARIFTAMMQPHPETGVILMSRVWWGYKYQDGQFLRDDDPAKMPCTEQILRNNLLHSSYEFNHLRKLLPLLRADPAQDA